MQDPKYSTPRRQLIERFIYSMNKISIILVFIFVCEILTMRLRIVPELHYIKALLGSVCESMKNPMLQSVAMNLQTVYSRYGEVKDPSPCPASDLRCRTSKGLII